MVEQEESKSGKREVEGGRRRVDLGSRRHLPGAKRAPSDLFFHPLCVGDFFFITMTIGLTAEGISALHDVDPEKFEENVKIILADLLPMALMRRVVKVAVSCVVRPCSSKFSLLQVFGWWTTCEHRLAAITRGPGVLVLTSAVCLGSGIHVLPHRGDCEWDHPEAESMARSGRLGNGLERDPSRGSVLPTIQCQTCPRLWRWHGRAP